MATTTVNVLSVAEFATRISRAVRAIGGGVVEGEIQRPRPLASGMLLFDLTDGEAKLSCKVFPGDARRLQHRPGHGDLVQVRIDRADMWIQAGTLSVIVSDIRLAGEGELLRRRRELLAKLTDEGVCDPSRRRPLPKFPRAVGVIAARQSDGLHDVVVALQNRFPPVHIVVCPATVQGARAPGQIIDALATLSEHPLVDVIVLARGGGSVQDLLAFDDERLCRAVFACPKPVIAAIGHTGNIPVCNSVAWAAETPSRSPELAVPSAVELRHQLDLAGGRLDPVAARLRSSVAALDRALPDIAHMVGARAHAVTRAGGILRDAEYRLFASRAAGLAAATTTLTSIRARIPSPAEVTRLGARLDAAATDFFASWTRRTTAAAPEPAGLLRRLDQRETQVNAVADGLRSAAQLLAATAREVSGLSVSARELVSRLDIRQQAARDHGERVRAGIRKELADHLRDYGRALKRLDGGARDGLRAFLGSREVELASTATTFDAAVGRRFADDRRKLDHLVTLLAASDPRRRGWVLPTDDTGSVIRTIGALTAGDRLTLTFHDGDADAVIENIHHEEDS